MIASVAFRNFKALRSARIELSPFNLVIGPNGSGKTSLIQAVLRLRTLARLPMSQAATESDRDSAQITFRFNPPHDGIEATLTCRDEESCDLLQLTPSIVARELNDWSVLRARLLTARAYLLDSRSIVRPVQAGASHELASDGSNLTACLAALRETSPEAFAGLRAELLQLFPEYADLVIDTNRSTFALRLTGGGSPVLVPADEVSQGTLYVLALLALAHDPVPPAIVCLEELDRGIHPRLLRGVRDVLYRLTHPADYGHVRAPVQVIATTHSPQLLDLFRDHPEEIVIADKHGRAATFARLSERADLTELLADGGTLGDLWYSGILGGVPEAT